MWPHGDIRGHAFHLVKLLAKWFVIAALFEYCHFVFGVHTLYGTLVAHIGLFFGFLSVHAIVSKIYVKSQSHHTNKTGPNEKSKAHKRGTSDPQRLENQNENKLITYTNNETKALALEGSDGEDSEEDTELYLEGKNNEGHLAYETTDEKKSKFPNLKRLEEYLAAVAIARLTNDDDTNSNYRRETTQTTKRNNQLTPLTSDSDFQHYYRNASTEYDRPTFSRDNNISYTQYYLPTYSTYSGISYAGNSMPFYSNYSSVNYTKPVGLLE